MDFDFEDIFKLGAGIIWVLWSLFSRFLKKPQSEGDAQPAPAPKVRRPAPSAKPLPQAARAPAPAPTASAARRVPAAVAGSAAPIAPSGPSAAQLRLKAELERLEKEAQDLGEDNRHALATRRFTPVLTEWLPSQARTLKEEILQGGPAIKRPQMERLNALHMVLAEVTEQVRQRKDPTLLPLLGDADALAEACYRPVLQFAKTTNLPLTTAQPVTRLSEVDLSIWTGFAPTSLAPLFLPQDFFGTVKWWPAVAHEIGHDFLLCVDGLRDRIARQLGLPSELKASVPLRLNENGLSADELWRVQGVWLEELFCDVFGTLMCGPAYGQTMVALFAPTEHPREVLVVPPDPQTGRYGVHPPRHLRLHVVAHLLEQAGFVQESKSLLQDWYQACGLDADEDVPLIFFTHQGFIQVPGSAVIGMSRTVVDALYQGPIDALRGHGLRDISGLDYGPALHAQVMRAKAALLAGQVPQVRDVRAIISGAVMAGLERPELEAQILHRARQAIPAVGTFERAPDAFGDEAQAHGQGLHFAQGLQRAANMVGPLDLGANAVAEAVVLRELLERRRPRPSPQRRAGAATVPGGR